jgi:hypothetical protein
MLIVLRKPAKVFKLAQTSAECPSPFMFVKDELEVRYWPSSDSNKPPEKYLVQVPDEEKLFLNSWNTK